MLGYRFRFTRSAPFGVSLGERTIVEDFNIWDAKSGSISTGQECWFGLYNIVMGPVEVGTKVSTAPHVTILGPHHAILGQSTGIKKKTVIGNNVWISTGAVIQFGVHIGDNAVIGVGAVVVKNVPPFAYVAGNPARELTRMADVAWNRANVDPV